MTFDDVLDVLKQAIFVGDEVEICRVDVAYVFRQKGIYCFRDQNTY